MNSKNRAVLRKQKSREAYQGFVNRQADDASRQQFIRGRYGGFDVEARSAILITAANSKVRGAAISARTLGNRPTLQRVPGGRSFAF